MLRIFKFLTMDTVTYYEHTRRTKPLKKRSLLEGLTPVRKLSCLLGVTLDPFLRVLNIVVFPT
jgi:hypothetical protein